ncbi:MAG: DNA polymerase Y family protein, partial [Pseudomonadota bacterium]
LLRRFGLTQIGQLYDIDRKALTRRFPSKSAAEAVMLRLDQALGRRAEPIRPLQSVPAREVRLPCPEPIASSEAIQHGLEQLAGQLCTALVEHGLGARGFVLRAFRADGSQDAVRIEAARPVRDPKHILRLFAERIDQLDPGFGIDLLLLEAHRTGPMSVSAIALSGDLAASDCDPVVLAALADRIQAKLGPNCVTVDVSQDRHLPEQASAREPFTGDLPPPSNIVKAPRPLRLFETPEYVTVLAEVPDGPPQRFVWRRIARHIVKADGPERISPEWWQHHAPPPRAPSPDMIERPWLSPKLDRRADAQQIAKIRAELEAEDTGTPISNLPRARDYYRVEDTEGRRYWLYRDGLYEDGRGGSPNWYIHGLFA